MRPRSRLSALLPLATLVLLGVLYSILPPFTASPYPMVRARNVPPTVVIGEQTEEKPPRDARQVVLDDDSIEPRTPAQQVRYLFYRCQHSTCAPREERQQLIAMGEKAFPTYESILSDPKATTGDVSCVLFVLNDVKADRRRFVKHAVARLTDTDFGVRCHAVALLYQIGSATEAPAVVSLLSDKEYLIVYWSAKTLAAIGGQRELEAMDKWLRGDNHRDNCQLREHVQKFRDELKKRLAAKKDSKK